VTDREEISAYLASHKRAIEEALSRFVPDESHYPPTLFQAMRYSLFAGGKRIRPILCLAAMDALGAGEQLKKAALPVACAIEMIHTYSLIHDDLPAMDNDDLRRGKPTSHRVFGEDIAILAGDALLTEAFHLLSKKELTATFAAQVILEVINEISYAVGCFGMIGGQVVDVRHGEQEMDEGTLYYIHHHKTGALLTAAVKTGGLLAGADEEKLLALEKYGAHMGLMFQIVDDLLDVEGDDGTFKKRLTEETSLGKLTFPSLLGIEQSVKKVTELKAQALEAIETFDDKARPLRLLVEHLATREV